MKVVIDIDEDFYNKFIYGDDVVDDDFNKFADIIACGTVLPNEMPWYLSIFNTELLKQKGHWIKKEDDTCWWYVCSECGQEPLKNRWNDDDVLSRFCPNCGAEMEQNVT